MFAAGFGVKPNFSNLLILSPWTFPQPTTFSAMPTVRMLITHSWVAFRILKESFRLLMTQPISEGSNSIIVCQDIVMILIWPSHIVVAIPTGPDSAGCKLWKEEWFFCYTEISSQRWTSVMIANLSRIHWSYHRFFAVVGKAANATHKHGWQIFSKIKVWHFKNNINWFDIRWIYNHRDHSLETAEKCLCGLHLSLFCI